MMTWSLRSVQTCSDFKQRDAGESFEWPHGSRDPSAKNLIPLNEANALELHGKGSERMVLLQII